LDLNPGVSVEGTSGREHEITGQVDEEEVFAIAYDVVKNKYSFDKSVKGWVSKTPVLGDEKRVQASHLGMAGADSDEELELEFEDEMERMMKPRTLCLIWMRYQTWTMQWSICRRDKGQQRERKCRYQFEMVDLCVFGLADLDGEARAPRRRFPLHLVCQSLCWL
jgi:hypothetical protein